MAGDQPPPGEAALEAAVKALTHRFCDVLFPVWHEAPERTLEALALALEAMSVRYIISHPHTRDRVLARLAEGVACVRAETTDGAHTRH
jgi:hypothetical protein